MSYADPSAYVLNELICNLYREEFDKVRMAHLSHNQSKGKDSKFANSGSGTGTGTGTRAYTITGTGTETGTKIGTNIYTITETGTKTNPSTYTFTGTGTRTGTSTSNGTGTKTSTSTGTGMRTGTTTGTSTGTGTRYYTWAETGPIPGTSKDRTGDFNTKNLPFKPGSSEVASLGQITKCPSCMQRYNQNNREPKVLRCGHTCCFDCALASDNPVECPTCGLPTNYSVLDVLEYCCDDCREHPRIQNCPHCYTTICNNCSPSHLEKYKDDIESQLTRLQDLHNRAESVIDESDEVHMRHHVDKLKQEIKENLARVIEALKEEEQKNYERLDKFLESGLDNLEELRKAGIESIQSNTEFMEDTQRKMQGESSFDELMEVRKLVDVFSEKLKTVLNTVKHPSQMVTLHQVELYVSAHEVVVNSVPERRGNKRSMLADETAQPMAKKKVDKSVTIKIEADHAISPYNGTLSYHSE